MFKSDVNKVLFCIDKINVLLFQRNNYNEKISQLIITVALLELKVLSLCHQYRVGSQSALL